MTPLKNLISLSILLVLLSSCGASKSEIVYFQGLKSQNTGSISSTETPKNLSIKANDLLSITVSALEQTAAAPFNLTIQGSLVGSATAQIQFQSCSQKVDTRSLLLRLVQRLVVLIRANVRMTFSTQIQGIKEKEKKDKQSR